MIIEAAVLLEAGWDNICDEVWLCSVSEDEQKRRLMQRDELDEVSASERIAHQARTQLDVTERSGRVHVVLSTEGCEEVLQEAVDGSPHGGVLYQRQQQAAQPRRTARAAGAQIARGREGALDAPAAISRCWYCGEPVVRIMRRAARRPSGTASLVAMARREAFGEAFTLPRPLVDAPYRKGGARAA